MSKLSEMIARLCPNGVEYKRFSEVCLYIRGVTYGKSQEVRSGEDGWKVLRANNITLSTNSLNYDDVKVVSKNVKVKPAQLLKKGDILICAGSGSKEHVGKVAYISEDSDCTFGGFMAVIRAQNGDIDTRYLYHVLTSALFINYLKSALNSTTINNLSNSVVGPFEIPLPPLPVQREIVQILDNFANLTAELTAELAKRKKQYEHYREKLMQFDADVPFVPLNTLFPLIRNGFVGTVTKYFTEKENGIRYLEGKNIHNGVIADNEELYVAKEFHQKHIKSELKADDILMVQSGHIGECAVVGEKYKGSNCHALIIMSNGGKCISKFYVHYFYTVQGMQHLKPAITDGNLKHVLAGKMGFVKVPYPPIEKQVQIVKTLDHFEQLCNSLTEGLPAEIALRKKQYEYYRDKLLSFKEAS